MATATIAPDRPFSEPLQRRFSVREYHQLMDAGVLPDDARCELVRGLIMEAQTISPPHATAIRVLNQQLVRVLGLDVLVEVQLPITLPDSEPLPDLVVARGSARDYRRAQPGPKDVLLLVEVFYSTLVFDQTTKLALYAASKISPYWIVNLIDRRVEVHMSPRGGKNPGYRQCDHYGPGQCVPVVLGGRPRGTIAVDDLV